MKNKVIALALCIAILAVVFILTEKADMQKDCIRIHIRANSNCEYDQQVKMMIRDRLVDYLTPILSNAKDKKEARSLINGELSTITGLAGDMLEDMGINYGVSCAIKREEFPLRSYNGIVFQSGEYEALIILLGEGIGDNWWCVAYPPLCFIPDGEGEVVYKSKILEIIKEYREKHGV